MTEERLPLVELLAKSGDGDILRSVAEAFAAGRWRAVTQCGRRSCCSPRRG